MRLCILFNEGHYEHNMQARLIESRPSQSKGHSTTLLERKSVMKVVEEVWRILLFYAIVNKAGTLPQDR